MSVLFIEAAFKTSFLLAAAAATNALLSRRTSAASRHLVWTLAVVGLLLLPILSAALPRWEIPVRIAIPAAPATAPALQSIGQAETQASSAGVGSPIAATAVGAPRNTPVSGPVALASALALLYVAGVFLLLMRLVAERRTAERLSRHAADIGDPAWTGLLIECAGLMGIQRPVRLLRSRDRTMPMAFGLRA